jgi:hypothetical protein
MRATARLLGVALVAGCAALPPTSDLATDPASDAPERRAAFVVPVRQHASYVEALAAWRGPEDLNAWIGAMFEYDTDRAVALSETQRAGTPAPPVHDPEAFFARPKGVCVDLARFAVETMARVSPELKARYLVIEFDPARLRGNVVRRHWVAVYERADGFRVVADSKRPGVIAGPYATIDEFVADYARYRGREVVAYSELDSYLRKPRAQARRTRSDASVLPGQ